MERVELHEVFYECFSFLYYFIVCIHIVAKDLNAEGTEPIVTSSGAEYFMVLVTISY